MKCRVIKLILSFAALSILCSCVPRAIVTQKRLEDNYEITSTGQAARLGATNSDIAMNFELLTPPWYKLVFMTFVCAMSSQSRNPNTQECRVFEGFELPYKEYTNIYDADNSLKEIIEREIKLNVRYVVGITPSEMNFIQASTGEILSFLKRNPDYEPVLASIRNRYNVKFNEYQPFKGYDAYTDFLYFLNPQYRFGGALVAHKGKLQFIDSIFSDSSVTENEFNRMLTFNQSETISEMTIGFYESVRSPDGTLKSEIRRKVSSQFENFGSPVKLDNIVME